MVFAPGIGSNAFSGHNSQLTQQSNYFRRGSERMHLGSTWSKPILDEKFARTIINNVLPHLTKNLTNKLNSEQIELFLAPDTWQFKLICNKNGLDIVDTDSTYGVSTNLGYKKLIIMNPRAIARKAEGSEKVNESSFILTLIHELTHMSGAGFETVQLSFNGKSKTFDLSPLNEGFTETFSRKLMKELYPKEFKSNKDKYYDEYISIAERMLGLADNRLLQTVFFEGPASGKLQAYLNQISRLDSKSAAGLFIEMNKICEASKLGKSIDHQLILENISKHLSVLENARQIQLARQKRQQELANLANSAKDKCTMFMNLRSGRNYGPASLAIRLAWDDEAFESKNSGSASQKHGAKGKVPFAQSSITINAKQIGDACGSDRKLTEAYLVKETLARVIACYGSFAYSPAEHSKSQFSQRNFETLDFGFPYVYANRLMKLTYPLKYLKFRSWSYPDERISNSFASLLGTRNVLTAFFNRDMRSLELRLAQMQAANKQALSKEIAAAKNKQDFRPHIIVSAIHKHFVLHYPFAQSSLLPQAAVNVWDDKILHGPIDYAHIKDIVSVSGAGNSGKHKCRVGYQFIDGVFYIDRSLISKHELTPIQIDLLVAQTLLWHFKESVDRANDKSAESIARIALVNYFIYEFLKVNDLTLDKSIISNNIDLIMGPKYLVHAIGMDNVSSLVLSPIKSIPGNAITEKIGLETVALEKYLDSELGVAEIIRKNPALPMLPTNTPLYFENQNTYFGILNKYGEGFKPMNSGILVKDYAFSQFESDFKADNYVGTLKLLSYAVPSLPPFYRMVLASNMLAYLNSQGSMHAPNVAQACLSLSSVHGMHSTLGSPISAIFFPNAKQGADADMAMEIHRIVQRNIISHGTSSPKIFDSIENKEKYDQTISAFISGGTVDATHINAALADISSAIGPRGLVSRVPSISDSMQLAELETDNPELRERMNIYWNNQEGYSRGVFDNIEYARMSANLGVALHEFAFACGFVPHKRDANSIIIKNTQSGMPLARKIDAANLNPLYQDSASDAAKESAKRSFLASIAKPVTFNAGDILFGAWNFNLDVVSGMLKAMKDSNTAKTDFLKHANLTSECCLGTNHFATCLE